MKERGQIIQIIPAQPGGFVTTKDENEETHEYPLICWALVDHEDLEDPDDTESKTPFRRMYGCFYLQAGGGDLYMVSEIGVADILEGERFSDYRF